MLKRLLRMFRRPRRQLAPWPEGDCVLPLCLPKGQVLEATVSPWVGRLWQEEVGRFYCDLADASRERRN